MKPSLLSGAIIVALSSLVGYHNVYMRAERDLQTLQDQQVHEQQTQDVRAQLADSLEAIERLRRRLPQVPEPEALMNEVSRLAQDSGIELTSIQPENPAPFNDFTRLAVSLQFISSYHRLGTFLGAIESSPMFLKVEDLDVVALGDGSSQIHVVITTLYVPPLIASNAAAGAKTRTP